MRPLPGIVLFLASTAWQSPDFHNIAAKAGLRRAIPNGGDTSKQFIIETTGSGVAFLDYDNDGLLDIFVVSGKGGSNRLYHNDGQGSFTDVSHAANVAAVSLPFVGWGTNFLILLPGFLIPRSRYQD